MRISPSVISCVISISIACWPTQTSATTIYRQTVQNDTGGDANDLTAVFTGPLGTLGPVKLRNDGQTAQGVMNGLTVMFAQGTFGSVSNAGMIQLDWETGNKTNVLDGVLSMWTLNGMPVGRITKIGQPMQLRRSQFIAFADFINPEPFPIVFSNISIFADNNPANFNIDQFSTPTGTLVSGLPSSLTLQPGASMTLSFNVTSASTYDLAFANVATVSNPTNSFQLVAAEEIPEPAIFTLIGLGIIVLTGYHKLARRRAG